MRRFMKFFWVGVAVSLLAVPVLGKGPKPSYWDGTIDGDIIIDVGEDGFFWEGDTSLPDSLPIGSYVPIRGLWLSQDLLTISESRITDYINNDPLDLKQGWRGDIQHFGFPSECTEYFETAEGVSVPFSFYSGNLRVMAEEEKESAGVRIDFLFSPCGPCKQPSWFKEAPPFGVDENGELGFQVVDDVLDCSNWNVDMTCPFQLYISGPATFSEENGAQIFTLSDSLLSQAEIILIDYTLGPVCSEEVSDNCVECVDGYCAYAVGVAPIDDDGPSFSEITVVRFDSEDGGYEAETGGTKCKDGVDNDGDKLEDCDDPDCGKWCK